jgi:hypothetical protein
MAASAFAQAAASPLRLLDVPYIQQSEALCGGAAAAMVMRYWGATGIRAESFASLLDPAAAGIRAEDLLRDLGSRGWNARSFRGDRQLVARRLADGQPVVALIEDRPGALHFVVIVAWREGRVVYHDPARAPYRVANEGTFEAAWTKTGHWTMLLLPPAAGVSTSNGSTASVGSATPQTPCEALVAEGVQAAQAGDPATALNVFDAAGELCPNASDPLRESAGVYALQENWLEAGRLAREAVKRNPKDEHAWRIAATSAYVRGDASAALEAWNRVGEPVIDLVNVIGLDRTRHSVASALTALDVGSVLTTQRLAVATRRLSELPTAEVARVNYRPLGGGRATVEAAVVERSLLPASRLAIASIGMRLLSERELAGSVASAFGGGELITASWRWWEHRPRVAFAFAAPSRAGVWRAEVFAEKQAYRAGGADVSERRRGGAVTLAQWMPTSTRVEIGTGIDAWNGDERTVNVRVSADQRLARDRVSLRAGATLFGGSFTAWTTTADVAWRSSIRHEESVVLARAGTDVASANAPLALWPGAGTGPARDVLLRAHPLLEDGRITGDVFGRRVAHAGIEVQRWLRPFASIVRIAPAVFVDAAAARERLHAGSAWNADAGVGLRLAAPGSGVLRVDVAKGLRDGATAFSVGWTK